MTYQRKLITILFLLLFSLFFGWSYAKLVSNTDFIISVVILSLSIISYVRVSTIASFAIMVSQILVLGAIAVFLTWLKHFSVYVEWRWIEVHSLYAALNILIWLNSFLIKQSLTETESLRTRLISLEKTIGTAGILTKREFLYQAEILLTATARRQESGYLLSVEIISSPLWSSSALFHTLATAFVSSVRGHFDLVGQASANKIWVMLQNTDEAGLEVVFKRVHQKIVSELDKSVYDVLRISAKRIHTGDTLTTLNLEE